MSETRNSPASLRAAGAIFASLFPKEEMDFKVATYLAEIIDRETASLKIPVLLGLLREWEATTHDNRPVAVLMLAQVREISAMLKDLPPADTNSPEVRKSRGAM